MSSNAKIYGVPNQRRVREAVVRIENQPYNFAPAKQRAPRLAGGTALLYCVPSGGIVAGTPPPGGTRGGPLTAQTIYASKQGSGGYTVLPGTYSIWNPHSTPVVTGRQATLKQNGDGTYDVVTQDCV